MHVFLLFIVGHSINHSASLKARIKSFKQFLEVFQCSEYKFYDFQETFFMTFPSPFFSLSDAILVS